MVEKYFFTGIERGEAFQISNSVELWSSLVPDLIQRSYFETTYIIR